MVFSLCYRLLVGHTLTLFSVFMHKRFFSHNMYGLFSVLSTLGERTHSDTFLCFHAQEIFSHNMYGLFSVLSTLGERTHSDTFLCFHAQERGPGNSDPWIETSWINSSKAPYTSLTPPLCAGKTLRDGSKTVGEVGMKEGSKAILLGRQVRQRHHWEELCS